MDREGIDLVDHLINVGTSGLIALLKDLLSFHLTIACENYYTKLDPRTPLRCVSFKIPEN